MSEAVKSLFTDISPTYDRLNHLLSLNLDKKWRKKAISMIQKQKNEPFLALDLCAGTFDLSKECLQQFNNSQIIAMDFSWGMLNAGLVKIQNELISGKITPICGDGLNMPLLDNSIDVVFCGYGVRNFDNTKKGLDEIYRVLKPGGQVIVLEFFKPDSKISRFFHKTYAQFLIPLMGKIISGHDSAYQYLRDSIQGFLTIEEFNNLLKECNFKQLILKDYLMSVSTSVSAIK